MAVHYLERDRVLEDGRRRASAVGAADETARSRRERHDLRADCDSRAVITITTVAVRTNMIHAAVNEHVNAKPNDVRALYADRQNWATVVSKTIRAAHAFV